MIYLADRPKFNLTYFGSHASINGSDMSVAYENDWPSVMNRY